MTLQAALRSGQLAAGCSWLTQRLLAGALPALLAPAGSTDVDPELSLQCRATLKALVPTMTDPAELDALLRW